MKFTLHQNSKLQKSSGNLHVLFQLIYMYLATRQMIHIYPLATGLDYIKMNWTNPRFSPERYQLKYLCTMKGISKYQAGQIIYIVNMTKNLSSTTTSVIISDLYPSRICTVILLAVYNPASNDKGIAFEGVTLGEHTSPWKSNFGF